MEDRWGEKMMIRIKLKIHIHMRIQDIRYIIFYVLLSPSGDLGIGLV